MKNAAVAILMTLLLWAPAAAETVERTFSAAAGGEIALDLETGGSISITGWGRSEVSVTADLGRYTRDEINLQMRSEGDRVTVSTEVKRDMHRSHSYRIRFEIKVPDRFNVEIGSAGGSVTIRDLEGRIRGETMGGELDLSGIRGRLDLKTMGGDVDLADAFVDGELTTMGGELTLNNVEGDLDAKTMGGDVTLRDVSGEVNAQTMGGDVIQAGSRGRGRGSVEGPVRLTTMGGEVRVDEAPMGAELETMGGDVIVGTAAVFVDASTMGGNIRIEEVDGRVKASTMGGNVDVRVVDQGRGDSHDVEINSASGTITLEVPSGFSMDVDVEIEWTRDHNERPRILSDDPLKIDERAAGEYGRDRDHGGYRKIIKGTGVVRGGQNRVVIRTVNGDVRIQSR